MSQNISKILALKVGKIVDNDEIKSAIKKSNIKESYLTKLGFNHDEQADKKHHGGENKAVLFYSSLTYEKLNSILNINLDYKNSSPLGENLLVSDVWEEDICVGDILKIGESVVQVTQPREPCNKLNINTQNNQVLKTVLKYGYTGWYAKVLEEGMIKQNDSVELVKKVYPNLTISKLNKLIKTPNEDKKLILEAISCEVLGKPFKEALEKVLDKIV